MKVDRSTIVSILGVIIFIFLIIGVNVIVVEDQSSFPASITGGKGSFWWCHDGDWQIGGDAPTLKAVTVAVELPKGLENLTIAELAANTTVTGQTTPTTGSGRIVLTVQFASASPIPRNLQGKTGSMAIEYKTDDLVYTPSSGDPTQEPLVPEVTLRERLCNGELNPSPDRDPLANTRNPARYFVPKGQSPIKTLLYSGILPDTDSVNLPFAILGLSEGHLPVSLNASDINSPQLIGEEPTAG